MNKLEVLTFRMREQTQCTQGGSPAKDLADWYQLNRRVLPWRQTRDPYAIWISETMLQQTRVDTVIPYYDAFMSTYPDVRALADAPEDEVLKRWQGLGYYSRARNLHRAARIVVEDFGGKIPDTEEGLKALPGVGPYTQGALLSIAFGQPVPAVDGNVLRVMARYQGIADPVDSTAVKRQVFSAVQTWLNEVSPQVLTQALMELGALICTPRSPSCQQCPIAASCEALKNDLTGMLPVKSKKPARKVVDVAALWLEKGGRVLMERRPRQGLLAGMWQLPAWELNRLTPIQETRVLDLVRRGYEELAAARADGENGVPSQFASSQLDYASFAVRESGCAPSDEGTQSGLDFAVIGQERHIFSHVEWHVKVYRPVGISLPELSVDEGRYEYVAREDIWSLPLPRVYEKLLQSILKVKG